MRGVVRQDAGGAAAQMASIAMNTAPNAQNGQPDAGAIRAQVERMTKSDVFANSPQLAAFLLFVVEAVLRGKSERLKGYTIGVEVLRRDINFDPQIDPIVRVEATRLRRAIERYYAGPGADDDDRDQPAARRLCAAHPLARRGAGAARAARRRPDASALAPRQRPADLARRAVRRHRHAATRAGHRRRNARQQAVRSVRAVRHDQCHRRRRRRPGRRSITGSTGRWSIAATKPSTFASG